MACSETTRTAILNKHYSTIGIEDVFLDDPPHPLPVVYLRQQYSGSPFTSFEVVGTIKSIPEDFCVREILTSSRKIPGLSDDDHEHLKVANVLTSDELPKQQVNMVKIKNSDVKGASTIKAARDHAMSDPKIPPDEIIRLYLEKTHPGVQSYERMMGELSNLNEMAKKVLYDWPSMEITDSVWLSPLVDLDPESARLLRGDLHHALKECFPLLYAKSAKKNDLPHWIEITIDDSYNELIPCLLDPHCDIPELLAFQKQGLSDASVGHRELPSVVLRLVPSATKEQRKLVHHLLAKRSKLFHTSTIGNVELPDGGGTTTAISVRWDIRSVDRKRKRGHNSSTSEKSSNPYPNTLVVLMKQKREHLTALHKITRTLKCRESDIGIAGIKDMHAVTYQFCTLRHTRAEHVATACRQLEAFGIRLSHFYKVDWVLNNGDLDGNEFSLVIRNLRRIHVAAKGEESFVTCDESHVQDRVDRVRRSGFINFYGEQRVGSAGSSADVGVRAFDIGRAMLQQDFSKAVNLMMTGRHGDESRESDSAKRVRQTWKDTQGDSKATLKAFVQGAENLMTREKIVLKGLNRFGDDKPLDAIRCLSYSVRMFWINAYQSFVWNQAASLRIKLYGKKAVEGDLYQDDISGEVKIVGLEVKNVKLSQIVLPLPGHSVVYPENEVGTLYKDLLAKDGIAFDDSGPPESQAKGTYRRLVIQPAKLEVEMIEDKDATKLTFQLPKGCYATMFLRELMLSTCTRQCVPNDLSDEPIME